MERLTRQLQNFEMTEYNELIGFRFQVDLEITYSAQKKEVNQDDDGVAVHEKRT